MTLTTPSLYSEGEETWDLKLHVGCGGIYLKDYINIDIEGWRVMETTPSWATDITDYYRGLDGGPDNLPQARETYADMLCDMRTLPYKPNTVDKIVCIQALEHLAPIDVRRAINHWWNILKPGGVLMLSVPDSDGTLELINENSEFAIRHLRGSLKNNYAGHLTWMTKETVADLLVDHGFTCEFMPNIHFYPAVVVRAEKLDTYVPDRSYQVLPWLEGAERVLDVGPGTFPLQQATHWLDINNRRKEFADRGYQGGFVCNLDILRPPFQDNEWDFLYASHIFEHLDDPLAVYQWMVRVSKAGYIEVPSAMLDYLMQHGGTHGKWMTLQHGDGMVMVAMSPRQRQVFRDKGMGTLFHRLTQYDIPLNKAEADVHRHFWSCQDVLNVSISWYPGQTPFLMVIDEEGRWDSWPT